jgi:protein-L-isoaspartate O-methyltransferase
MNEDAELLAHYLARGREPWNVSLEAAWLDYELRAFFTAHLPARRPLAVCNVGIGVGLFDDWLGHVVAAPITSVDRDPAICRVLALRQAREGHPYPARVLCGDVRDGVLAAARFDVIAVVGSTLAESGDREATRHALEAALAPAGRLLVAEVGEGAPPAGARTCRDLWLACTVWSAGAAGR